jgi:hypothetical protein
MRKNRWLRALKFFPLALLFVALFGLIVMTLWNWLMPALFGLKMVTYWQAIGLVILSKILFGGFRGGPGGRHWRHRMMERWEQMTPEEREKFRQGMRGGFRGAEPPAAST